MGEHVHTIGIGRIVQFRSAQAPASVAAADAQGWPASETTQTEQSQRGRFYNSCMSMYAVPASNGDPSGFAHFPFCVDHQDQPLH
jgi:hypothetical protein